MLCSESLGTHYKYLDLRNRNTLSENKWLKGDRQELCNDELIVECKKYRGVRSSFIIINLGYEQV